MASSSTFWTITDWQAAYKRGETPDELLASLIKSFPRDDVAWISHLSANALQLRLNKLAHQKETVGGNLAKLPLYGIPFAVKDNIDVIGFPTTCACPEFAYEPAINATVIDRLEAAGAIVIGKTNLDQFATGLVGTRSPFGVVPNTFKPGYISGGSSSGSASVVARGLVPFALGTDTAGSGRIPAGHNNLVGFKPTRGLVSNSGLVPACRSLDCISVFTLDVNDADSVQRIMSGFDVTDPYSRRAPARSKALPTKPVLGIPVSPEWFGDTKAQRVYTDALEKLKNLGVELRPIDFTPLFETAALLYEGPWVAERYAAVENLMNTQPSAVHPVVRAIIEKAKNFTAVDTYKAEYQRLALARKAEALMQGLDGLLVPTAPTIYTIEQVLADPITLNSHMGTYTNFVNLLDWSAIALPAGIRADGLPAGITLITPAWQETRLIEFGRRWQIASPWKRGASQQELPTINLNSVPNMSDQIVVAVVGAHLSGMPLNTQLTERGAVLLESTQTSAAYQLYALPNTTPPKPGLVRTGKGAPIAVELWAMPVENFGSFVGLIPSPLGIGNLELVDGRTVKGFICEPWAIDGAQDITHLGGWRAYMGELQKKTQKGD